MAVKRLRPGDENIVRACVEIASRKYPAFDLAAAYQWGCAALARADIAVFVTMDCFAVSVTYQRFWAPGQNYADVVLLCSGRHDKRSAVQLLELARAIRAWAVENGCVRLDFDPEMGVDFGPLARRVGSAERQIGWMVRLNDG